MAIKFEKVSFSYYPTNSNKIVYALKEASLNIEPVGEFIAILGHTGSGKSTLIQHMNALLLPTEGSLNVFGTTIKHKNSAPMKPIREKVGLVFQFPEYQLFEETVKKDIMFGPKNFGCSNDEASKRAEEVVHTVGLDDTFLDRTPFNLSGGQMRRVALAGILAMKPNILVLDEPTVGLDPKGKEEIMDLFYNLHVKDNKTIIMVTHDMDVVAKYAKRVVVLKKGEVVFDGPTRELFSKVDLLEKYNLDIPETIQIMNHIKDTLKLDIDVNQLTIDEVLNELRNLDK